MNSTIALMTAPNASIPGCLCVVQTLPGFRVALKLRQAEWVYDPAGEALEAVSRVLWALHDKADPGPLPKRRKDPRDDNATRLIILDNFWTSCLKATREQCIHVDGVLHVVPGGTIPTRERPTTAGRSFLLDRLRDLTFRLTVALPKEPLGDHPAIVDAFTLKSALRSIALKPRLLDEESAAPGLDREDVLVLTLAAAVHDAENNWGGSGAWHSPAPVQGIRY